MLDDRAYRRALWEEKASRPSALFIHLFILPDINIFLYEKAPGYEAGGKGARSIVPCARRPYFAIACGNTTIIPTVTYCIDLVTKDCQSANGCKLRRASSYLQLNSDLNFDDSSTLVYCYFLFFIFFPS